MVAFGKRFAAWRKHAGLTQRDLAEAACVSGAALAQWETGSTNPAHEHLTAAVREMGISMEQFWGELPKRKAA